MTWGAFIFHVLLEVEVYTLVLQKNMYFQVSLGPTKFKIPCIYIHCGLMTEYIFICFLFCRYAVCLWLQKNVK